MSLSGGEGENADMIPLPYSLGYLLPFTLVLAAILRGPWALLPGVLTLVLLPLLDHAIGADVRNPTADEEASVVSDPRYDWILVGIVPSQILATLFVVVQASIPATSGWEALALGVSTGICNGVVAVGFGHELVHRVLDRNLRLLGTVLLVLVAYPHWAVSHVAGHHRWVGTRRDPATARGGESLYAFLPRAVSGTLRDAWELETERLAFGGGPFGRWNRVVTGWIAVVVLGGMLTLAFGACGFLFFLGQAAVAILLVEAVNYVEHYGLLRPSTGDGTWVPVTPFHSWSQGNRLTNALLVNRQRHADHHAHPQRVYPILRHFPGSPLLPTGTLGMVLLAGVPPLWFSVMDRRVAKEPPSGAVSA